MGNYFCCFLFGCIGEIGGAKWNWIYHISMMLTTKNCHLCSILNTFLAEPFHNKWINDLEQKPKMKLTQCTVFNGWKRKRIEFSIIIFFSYNAAHECPSSHYIRRRTNASQWKHTTINTPNSVCGERRAFSAFVTFRHGTKRNLEHFSSKKNAHIRTHYIKNEDDRIEWKLHQHRNENEIMWVCSDADAGRFKISTNSYSPFHENRHFIRPRRKALWWYPVIWSTSKVAPNKCCFIIFFYVDCDTCDCSDVSVFFGAAMYWLNVWVRGELIKHRSVETFRRNRTYIIFCISDMNVSSILAVHFEF